MGPSPGGLASRFLQNLWRRAGNRQLPLPAGRPQPRTTPNQVVEQGKRFARDVWNSTFGHLERGTQGAYETLPLRRGPRMIGGRRWPSSTQGREYHQASQTASRSPSRTAVRTPAIRSLAGNFRRPAFSSANVGNVGLQPSPARTFATYGPQFASEIYSNVSLGMRALADRLHKQRGDRKASRAARPKKISRTDEKDKVGQSMKRYRYERMHPLGSSAVSAASAGAEEKREKRAEEYKAYFSLGNEVMRSDSSVQEQETHHDLRGEKGRTTYLLLPLAPSLSHLLSFPSASTSMSTDMTHDTESPPDGLRPARTATPLPLLETLAGMVNLSSDEGGWLRTRRESNDVDVEVVYGSPESVTTGAAQSGEEMEPEALRLVFHGWTEASVERLVRRAAGALTPKQSGIESERGWWYIYSVVHSPAAHSATSIDGQSSEHDYDDMEFELDLGSSLSTTPGTITPLSSSFSSVVSDGFGLVHHTNVMDDAGDAPFPVAGAEEQDVWGTSMMVMPTLSATGASLVGSAAEENELEWVESRVWAERA